MNTPDGVGVQATLEGMRLEMERMRLQLQIMNGAVAEAKLWRQDHDQHHHAAEVALAARHALEDGRREIIATVSARDKWTLGLTTTVIIALATIASNILVKVLT